MMTDSEFFEHIRHQTLPRLGHYEGPIKVRWHRYGFQLYNDAGDTWSSVTQEQCLEWGFKVPADPTPEELQAVKQSIQHMIDEVS